MVRHSDRNCETVTVSDDPLAPLVRRAVAGDRAAMDQLCRALEQPLFRLALRILGEPADARDATQEILLQIVTHLSQFRAESRVSTWAYAIATRCLLRARKKRSQRLNMERLETRIRLGLASTEDVAARAFNGPLAVETCVGCTNAMLQAISLHERMAVVLCELLGADDHLAAQLCGVSEPVHRKRLSRGRAKLRPILERLCGLAREAAPCSGERQLQAKRRAGLAVLPNPELRIAAADAEFRKLRELGAVFAFDAHVVPAREIWGELRRRLPAVFSVE